MSEPILDPTALERLRRIGGDRLLRMMMTSFVEHGAVRMATARAAAAAGDGKGVSEEAHALKSTAGNIGASALQRTAQKVEGEAVVAGADLGALVSELVAAFEVASVAAASARDEAGTSD
jgi:HPt (histidine-containing phosphotransfer) domain-containing protein